MLSILGEIANVITGNAATELAANDFPCDISPPVIVEPRGSTLTSTVRRQILVTFKSDLDLLTGGTEFPLAPGEALYVPVMAPHFVRNCGESSISLSVTWRSEWSYGESDARCFNGVARRYGLSPRPPRRWVRYVFNAVRLIYPLCVTVITTSSSAIISSIEKSVSRGRISVRRSSPY